MKKKRAMFNFVFYSVLHFIQYFTLVFCNFDSSVYFIVYAIVWYTYSMCNPLVSFFSSSLKWHRLQCKVSELNDTALFEKKKKNGVVVVLLFFCVSYIAYLAWQLIIKLKSGNFSFSVTFNCAAMSASSGCCLFQWLPQN